MASSLPPLGAPGHVALEKLQPEETRRYGRHLILSEIGVEGQERLKSSRVLLVGAGGLGSPMALYLAAAGVGTLGLVDFDTVDETNLHRQLLHGTADVGRPKLDSARDRLREVNPHVTLECHEMRLDASNAAQLVAGYDLVADGSDNFGTRYLVNDACVMAGKTNVWGAVFQFEGQVSVFGAPDGPCYRCLYPDPPPPGSVPNCAEGGVLGVLPGIIGLLQANEVIKLLLGIGEPLVGRLSLFDALNGGFREVRLAKDPQCPVCGERPSVTELVEYEGYCEVVPLSDAATSEPAISEATPVGSAELLPFDIPVQELASRRDAPDAPVILDVRTQQERAIASVDGSIWIPMHELPQRLQEIESQREVAVLCHSGIRSTQVVHFLRQQGFDRSRNIAGGIDRWSVEVDSSVPRY